MGGNLFGFGGANYVRAAEMQRRAQELHYNRLQQERNLQQLAEHIARQRQQAATAAASGPVIEGEYEIIDEPSQQKERPAIGQDK